MTANALITALYSSEIPQASTHVCRRLARLLTEDVVDNVLVSIPEAGRMLSVGRSTLYRLISDGQLETVKIGRRTLVRIASIRALAGEAA